MKTNNQNKSQWLLIKISSTFIVVAIAFITLLTKTTYRPSVYLYQLLSWFNCSLLSKTTCQLADTNNTPQVAGKNGAVVSTQHYASEIGKEILAKGGNAIDAAVAVGYALAVTDPCCGNLGGGGFMLIRLANGKETFINFREKAPLAATPDMYLDEKGNLVKGLSTEGYLAVGVPGTVKGLDYALKKYGTISRQQAISPAIKLAKNGFTLQSGDVEILKAGKEKLLEPNVTAIFLKNGKKNYQVGNVLKQQNLAKTLELIAQKGTNSFYQGAIAKKIVTASQQNGGILSLKDFANYTVSEDQPIECNYRGYQVISSPPPGGGTTVCQMLNILSGYNLQKLGWRTPESLHLMFSSMLFAYRDRNFYLGDPNFIYNPIAKLLSNNYAASLRQKIPQDKAISPESVNSTKPLLEGTNTTHYSVADRYGNAVAVTYTINSYFGAGVIAADTGFFLNNEMDDFTAKVGESNQFSLQQGINNQIEPGKRPLSSMSPTIVTKNGEIFLITGSPGGSTIPTTVMQVITNIIDYQFDINKAVNSPRIHYQGQPNIVRTEPFAISPKNVNTLTKMGYHFIPTPRWGAAESIHKNPESKLFFGANDRFKPAGSAIVY
jgi:gamma-glutamyltranspeptidase/glutathione hydrolase